MASTFESPSTVYQVLSVNENNAVQSTQSLLPPSEQNMSAGPGCFNIIFSEVESLSLGSPDINFVSYEVENTIRRIKENSLACLFLIGGPVNVINMAVFHKQGLRDRVTLLLFALSLADLMFLCVSFTLYSQQFYLQFTTQERFGPIMSFLINKNYITFVGFSFVSHALSTIVAVERCLCVMNPLKFQHLLRTRTTAIIIALVYCVLISGFCIVAFRYRIVCVDPVTGTADTTGVEVEFYLTHKELINSLDGFVYGMALPGSEMVVVMIVTTLTTVRLRQTMSWRSERSSSISPREVALTKMLIGNSILFVICIAPVALMRYYWIFLPDVDAGRRSQNFFLTCLWISEMFTYINSTCNFFVYYTMGSRYRETFWTLLGKKPLSEKEQQLVKN